MLELFEPLITSIRLRSLFLGILVIGLSGCGGDDMSDLNQYFKQIKSQQKASVPPLPEIKTVAPFVFNPVDLRDPFFIDEKTQEIIEENNDEGGIRPDWTRTKEELESFELDSLRMVGTVIQQNTLLGLVKAADGTIHRVLTGNYMGKNNGKIVSIKENQIELIEVITEGSHAWKERKATLELTESSGGKK